MKNMKNIKSRIITTLLLMLSLNISAQISVDSFYTDKSQNLIHSQIVEFDSLSQEYIVNKVKNWAGTNFVNMKEVLVSETKDQLVFNYITKDFVSKVKFLGSTSVVQMPWYFRMVVQIKNNRIRILIYDDGNAFWPGSYSQYGSTPSTAARTYKFTSYFDKQGLAGKYFNEGLIDVKKSCLLTCQGLIDEINKIDKQPGSDW